MKTLKNRLTDIQIELACGAITRAEAEFAVKEARLLDAAPDMLAVCKATAAALWVLCNHPAFAGDAPEFNEGGIGYNAMYAAHAAIDKATKE